MLITRCKSSSLGITTSTSHLLSHFVHFVTGDHLDYAYSTFISTDLPLPAPPKATSMRKNPSTASHTEHTSFIPFLSFVPYFFLSFHCNYDFISLSALEHPTTMAPGHMRLHRMYRHIHLISDEESRHVKDRNTLVENAFLRLSSRSRVKVHAPLGSEDFHPCDSVEHLQRNLGICRAMG